MSAGSPYLPISNRTSTKFVAHVAPAVVKLLLIAASPSRSIAEVRLRLYGQGPIGTSGVTG